MKKKGIILVVMTFLLIVAGCTSKDYKSNIELGKEQLQAENYLEAYDAFSAAYKDDETAEAKELKELSKLLADGIAQYNQKKYDTALTIFEKTAGYDAKIKEGKKLASKADEWVSKVDNAQNNAAPLEKGQLGPNDPATLEEGNMDTPKGNTKSDKNQTNSPSQGNHSNAINKGNDPTKNDPTKVVKKITVKEAEQLVKDFIEIKNYPQLSLQYDHNDEKGDYIFQVFESVEDGQGGHTATWGWYGVNPKTKEVYDIM